MPSFAEVIVGQSDGLGKKPTNQVQVGKDSLRGTGREKVEGLYPIIEGPTKTIQMPEMAIKGIKAPSDKSLVCCFNGY